MILPLPFQVNMCGQFQKFRVHTYEKECPSHQSEPVRTGQKQTSTGTMHFWLSEFTNKFSQANAMSTGQLVKVH